MSPVRSSRFAASSCSTNQGWSPSGRSSIVAHGVGEPGIELARAERLEEGLGERPADAHRLAHGLHLRPERRVGARELLEREARELDDDVVERRLEARRRRLRQVVRDLVERVADGELRRDLRDGVAGRLRGERRRAGDARVHLDHAQLARVAVPRELDVRTARLDADRADHRGGRVAKLLVGLVGERHLRRHRDRVARVDAHRVEVLDRADDHDVVSAVADHLELELVPAADRLLDEHLADWALGEAALDLPVERLGVVREAAAVAAERERRPDDSGNRRAVESASDSTMRDSAPRGRSSAPRRGRAGGPPRADDVHPRAQELDAELLEHPRRSSSIARFNAVCPPSVGRSASGRSRRRTSASPRGRAARCTSGRRIRGRS
jgi:hypothetical protein